MENPCQDSSCATVTLLSGVPVAGSLKGRAVEGRQSAAGKRLAARHRQNLLQKILSLLLNGSVLVGPATGTGTLKLTLEGDVNAQN